MTAELVSRNVPDNHSIATTCFAQNTMAYFPKDMIIHFLENSKMQLKSTDLIKNTVLLSCHCTGLAHTLHFN